eukprot:COSAG01_NODE_9760_length_2351_cov_104.297957_1_plen_87_part_10
MARGNNGSAAVLQTPAEGEAGAQLSVEERMRAVLFLIAASELFAEHSMPALWLDEMEQVRTTHTASEARRLPRMWRVCFLTLTHSLT